MESRSLDILARELRQPVDALGLLTHALRRRLQDDGNRADAIQPEVDVILQDIDLGLVQLRRQLASVVDLVRAERSLARAQRVEFPLMPIFEKLVLQTARFAHDNQAKLSVVPTRAWVASDPAALEIILRNLVVNGLFFARGGRVVLGCRKRGSTIQIQVADNGVGIARADQDVIFEPLKKLQRDGDGMIEGLGLGLSLVRDLARTLGHDIDLRSEPAKGSLFTLTLPRAATGGPTQAAASLERSGS